MQFGSGIIPAMLINATWPDDLCPTSCEFGRSRNDLAQASPRTRLRTVILQGRPLWTAQLSWRIPRKSTRLGKLRCYLDRLEGFSGSVQLPDFGNVIVPTVNSMTASSANLNLLEWENGGNTYVWTNSGQEYYWQYVDGGSQSSVAALAGAETVGVTGGPVSTTIATCGQYVQAGRRLYMLASDVTTDASGDALLTFTSPVVSQIDAGDTLNFLRPAVEMQLAVQEWGQSENSSDGFATVSAAFIESVEDVA